MYAKHISIKSEIFVIHFGEYMSQVFIAKMPQDPLETQSIFRMHSTFVTYDKYRIDNDRMYIYFEQNTRCGSKSEW